jgi:2-polyprenyl-3-methyl-5-hydroxy-6-metoxy-1,4-benzoquinol methylase
MSRSEIDLWVGDRRQIALERNKTKINEVRGKLKNRLRMVYTDDRGYSQGWVASEATRVRAERRCDYMISRMGATADSKILEIGCGLGANAFMIARKTCADVLATDLCVPFIQQAREKFCLPNLRYEVDDFHCADRIETQTFDCIVGNGILHHLYPRLDEALVKIQHLLKVGGRIVFLEPNIYNPYVYLIFRCQPLRRRARLEPDEMAFSKRFVTAKLHCAGYRNVRVEFRDFLIPGIPSYLIRPSVRFGAVLERIPAINWLAQSIFIEAEK